MSGEMTLEEITLRPTIICSWGNPVSSGGRRSGYGDGGVRSEDRLRDFFDNTENPKAKAMIDIFDQHFEDTFQFFDADPLYDGWKPKIYHEGPLKDKAQLDLQFEEGILISGRIGMCGDTMTYDSDSFYPRPTIEVIAKTMNDYGSFPARKDMFGGETIDTRTGRTIEYRSGVLPDEGRYDVYHFFIYDIERGMVDVREENQFIGNLLVRKTLPLTTFEKLEVLGKRFVDSIESAT